MKKLYYYNLLALYGFLFYFESFSLYANIQDSNQTSQFSTGLISFIDIYQNEILVHQIGMPVIIQVNDPQG